MIKLSWMARSADPEEYSELIRFARDINLDAVDFHLQGFSREPDYLRKIKMLCLKNGLTVGYLGLPGTFVGPADELKNRVEEAKADVDTAAFLGAQMLRVFARHSWPETVEEQEALWGPMIERLQQLSDYAATKGIAVGLQNHNNNTFAMNADQVLRMLKDTDRKNFTYIMDTGQWQGAIGSHPRGEFDPNIDLYKDYLERTAPYATYVRAKIYKIDSGREEWLDYPRIFRMLKGLGYNGNVSIVFEGGDRNKCSTKECIKLAADYLRKVISDIYS